MPLLAIAVSLTYRFSMSKKLSSSNPYLRDPIRRKDGLWISAKTSSAIEGICKPFATREAASGKIKQEAKSRRASRSAAKSA